MPLTMTKAGDTVTIRKITGKDEVRQHLAELGLVIVKGIPHTPLLRFCNILAYANAWSKSMRLERSNRLRW